ncbi:hypothetical protein OAA09_01210 [bacterium]|nr:hypothetical protein [bacterium]
MKKGDLVMFDPTVEVVQRKIRWGIADDDVGYYLARRPTTEAERRTWEIETSLAIQEGKQPWHDSAGEPRLPPMSKTISFPIDAVFIVERARCRVQLNYGNASSGMARILHTQSGEYAYVPRGILEVVK